MYLSHQYAQSELASIKTRVLKTSTKSEVACCSVFTANMSAAIMAGAAPPAVADDFNSLAAVKERRHELFMAATDNADLFVSDSSAVGGGENSTPILNEMNSKMDQILSNSSADGIGGNGPTTIGNNALADISTKLDGLSTNINQLLSNSSTNGGGIGSPAVPREGVDVAAMITSRVEELESIAQSLPGGDGQSLVSPDIIRKLRQLTFNLAPNSGGDGETALSRRVGDAGAARSGDVSESDRRMSMTEVMAYLGKFGSPEYDYSKILAELGEEYGQGDKDLNISQVVEFSFGAAQSRTNDVVSLKKTVRHCCVLYIYFSLYIYSSWSALNA